MDRLSFFRSQTLVASQKGAKASFPSFRRKPESRLFEHWQNAWTPVFTGATTSQRAVKRSITSFETKNEGHQRQGNLGPKLQTFLLLSHELQNLDRLPRIFLEIAAWLF